MESFPAPRDRISVVASRQGPVSEAEAIRGGLVVPRIRSLVALEWQVAPVGLVFSWTDRGGQRWRQVELPQSRPDARVADDRCDSTKLKKQK